MKLIDRLIRQWRFSKARIFVEGDCLDVGCHDGSWLASLPLGHHLGIDSALPDKTYWKDVQTSFPSGRDFNTISCLATYEHFQHHDQELFWKHAVNCLRTNGKIVMTIPHSFVDVILYLLVGLRLADGMETHQHVKVETADVIEKAWEHKLRLVKVAPFMLGLNRVFVFEKINVQ